MNACGARCMVQKFRPTKGPQGLRHKQIHGAKTPSDKWARKAKNAARFTVQTLPPTNGRTRPTAPSTAEQWATVVATRPVHRPSKAARREGHTDDGAEKEEEGTREPNKEEAARAAEKEAARAAEEEAAKTEVNEKGCECPKNTKNEKGCECPKGSWRNKLSHKSKGASTWRMRPEEKQGKAKRTA